MNQDVYEGDFKEDRMAGAGVYSFSPEGRSVWPLATLHQMNLLPGAAYWQKRVWVEHQLLNNIDCCQAKHAGH